MVHLIKYTFVNGDNQSLALFSKPAELGICDGDTIYIKQVPVEEYSSEEENSVNKVQDIAGIHFLYTKKRQHIVFTERLTVPICWSDFTPRTMSKKISEGAYFSLFHSSGVLLL